MQGAPGVEDITARLEELRLERARIEREEARLTDRLRDIAAGVGAGVASAPNTPRRRTNNRRNTGGRRDNGRTPRQPHFGEHPADRFTRATTTHRYRTGDRVYILNPTGPNPHRLSNRVGTVTSVLQNTAGVQFRINLRTDNNFHTWRAAHNLQPFEAGLDATEGLEHLFN